ncbi:hypothetical protein [Streptomyces albus]
MPGTQGAPLDEPQEPRSPQPGQGRAEEQGRAPEGEEELPDNTRPFPKAPPAAPGQPGNADDDTWPHGRRDAA